MPKNPWSPNPYPDRGHRHRWTLTKDTPACQGYRDWFSSEDVPSKPRRLVRECADCGAKQTAEVEDESVLVKGYESSADVEWKDIL